MIDAGTPLVEMRNITKRFGRIRALSNVDMDLYEDEILGIVGDNGAGKSTLIKTLVGVHQPDRGSVLVRGEEREITSPKRAREVGISTVYQDLALVDELDVAANVFLGRNPTQRIANLFPVVDWNRMYEESDRLLREFLGLDLDVESSVEFLSGGERQAVAIARALVTNPDVVIMDEPTSALSAEAAERVRELLFTLRSRGVSIILISHNISEILSVADRIVVLHNGTRVGGAAADEVTKEEVIRMMMGDRKEAVSR